MAEKKTGIFAEIVKPTLVLLVICIVISGALAVTNFITKDKIAEQEKKATVEAMENLVPDADAENLNLESPNEGYMLSKNGQIVAYVFITSSKGYKSDVKVMTAIDAKSGQVTGVTVTSCDDETPGLGQKAKDDTGAGLALRESFKGKTEIDTESKEDCMTGATLTSKAVKRAVQQALDLYKQVGGAN